MGNFGAIFARINMEFFGYLAYFYLLFLIYPAYLCYRETLSDWGKTELVLAGILGILSLLVFQALILQKGKIGGVILDFLYPFIGLLGVCVLILIGLVTSYAMLFPSNFLFLSKSLYKGITHTLMRIKNMAQNLPLTELKKFFTPSTQKEIPEWNPSKQTHQELPKESLHQESLRQKLELQESLSQEALQKSAPQANLQEKPHQNSPQTPPPEIPFNESKVKVSCVPLPNKEYEEKKYTDMVRLVDPSEVGEVLEVNVERILERSKKFFEELNASHFQENPNPQKAPSHKKPPHTSIDFSTQSKQPQSPQDQITLKTAEGRVLERQKNDSNPRSINTSDFLSETSLSPISQTSQIARSSQYQDSQELESHYRDSQEPKSQSQDSQEIDISLSPSSSYLDTPPSAVEPSAHKNPSQQTHQYCFEPLASDNGYGAVFKPRPLIVKELAENKQLLEELDFGEVEKPKDYQLPSTQLLQKPKPQSLQVDENEIDKKIQDLLSKLKMFKIDGDIARTYSGPIVTTFEFRPAPNVKVSRILTLGDDLAMALCAQSIRIQAPIPGKDVVGIEIPNAKTDTIYLREILESELFENSASPLTLALGKDIVGNPFITDLKKLPHLLIAGTTGSGKSVGVNAMILSLLFRNSPDNLKLIMIDPKMVEFSMYADIPHLLTPIITNPKKAIAALVSAVNEMERRYKLMSACKTKNIDKYNPKAKAEGLEVFPFLVIIIDELADLMMTGGKEAEFPIARIAQMGRAAGLHLIVATQRPSVDVVTGLIKTNLPSRISFKVGSKIDSRVVLDVEGAQSLLGRGDMLFTPPGIGGVVRLHAPWASEEEIEEIVEYIKAQREVIYSKDFLLDEAEVALPVITSEGGDLIMEAKKIILQDKKTSISYLQRRLGVGYNKAASVVEELQNQGFLSEPNSKGVREIVGI
ncbi:DNA translocase FtsK [Helicobacter sp. 12S02634-8]|uniref:FtsK/SpoIIIE family DNA translocase n=1 Tax=Helicobacter sp. 12S02634-8 TaxID=1476199 RepID=UPI00209C1041|nr:DNA translocase FtsK [Helicobacter sp. 12S02634-8]